MSDKKVIIIDDDTSHFNRLRVALKASLIEVLVAENGYDLTRYIYSSNANVLIFNCNISWLNSIEFVKNLKKTKKDRDFTVVFVSDTYDKTLSEEAKKLNIICLKEHTKISDFLKIVENTK